MSKTIELPIPNAETREEIRKLAHQLAMDSIVMQTLERYLIQVLTEVHESRIKPLLEKIERMEARVVTDEMVKAGLDAKLPWADAAPEQTMRAILEAAFSAASTP